MANIKINELMEISSLTDDRIPSTMPIQTTSEISTIEQLSLDELESIYGGCTFTGGAIGGVAGGVAGGLYGGTIGALVGSVGGLPGALVGYAFGRTFGQTIGAAIGGSFGGYTGSLL